VIVVGIFLFGGHRCIDVPVGSKIVIDLQHCWTYFPGPLKVVLNVDVHRPNGIARLVCCLLYRVIECF